MLTEVFATDPILLVGSAVAAVVALVFGTLALAMWRAGASLRPLVFVGVFLAIVGGPQLLFHFARARGWIPPAELTWVADSDGVGSAGYAENEAILAGEDGHFVHRSRIFPGAGSVVDLRSTSGGPFTGAEVAQMGVLEGSSTIVIARFASAAAARAAAEAFLLGAAGTVAMPAADGTFGFVRPAGDAVRLVLTGRTVGVFSAADDELATRLLRQSAAFSPAEVATPAKEEVFWLYRPLVLLAIGVILLLAAVLWFWRGAEWAASVPPIKGVHPVARDELRRRLLSIEAVDVPFTVREESPGGRLIATWRFADAKWIDLARARGMRATHRIVLELDAATRSVRAQDQFSAVDWSAGADGGSGEWGSGRGIIFFQVQHERVFGLQLDEQGRFRPELSHAWRFDLQEMKAPLIAATVRSGWEWRPVLFSVG